MICGVADSISIPYSESLNSGPTRQIMHVFYADCAWVNYGVRIQGGSNMTGTDLYVNKPHSAVAVRP